MNALHIFIDMLADVAKAEGKLLVKQAQEQTEREFESFRRSVGQKFRWIRHGQEKRHA